MIRYQITSKNPIELNTAARVLSDSGRLIIDEDSGNRNGRKEGYIRYIHAKVRNRVKPKPKPKPAPKPKPRLDAGEKLRLAKLCWAKIVYKTDGDEEAHRAIIELIEYVERKFNHA